MRARIMTTLTAAALAFGGLGAPAHAAVPVVAQQWSQLMYESLTVTAQAAQLRVALAAQRADVTVRTTAVATAESTAVTALTRASTATITDAAAQGRLVSAGLMRTAAKKTLARATAQRPRDAVKVDRATKAVAAAETSVAARLAEAREAAAALVTARDRLTAADTAIDTAQAAWTTAVTAAQRTRDRLVALPTAASLLTQADAMSRDVVAQIRPVFTTADTVSVYGVTVHQRVAYSFRRMIDAAKADGVVLSGGGFRTRQRQIELRTINGCPDVWTAPASSCRVPTAIPGRSLHELGLAVDITSGGRSLTAKSPGFVWLSAHAASYGYHNLPSEPWHWSITGG